MSETEYKAQELGQIFMRARAWGEIRTFIEKVCQKENTCDLSEVKKKLNFIEDSYFESEGVDLWTP